MRQSPLHPTLAKDGIPVCELSACSLLLMNDRQYPWLILVPDRPNLTDLDELVPEDSALVAQDIRRASETLRKLFKPTKLNVAALGNVVPQLHIHVIARFENDPAWPKPVWGLLPPIPYPDADQADLLAKLKSALGGQTP